jgi:predicted O-methyltransferase YrrM
MIFEFDQNWHQNQVPYLTHHLLPLFKDKKDIRALEIGSFEGRSTAWWLDNLPIKEMVCVDTWEGTEEDFKTIPVDFPKVFENFKSNVGDRVKWIKESSHTAIPKLEGEFDFIYVDGSHMAKDVLLDGLLCDRVLAKGGLILFDDYMWEVNKRPEFARPEVGINAFYDVNFHLYEMMFKGYQICFRKM